MRNNYKNLNVWKKSIAYVKRIYELVSSFPEEEKYGLNSQMKRAVVSIPSNIAEGAGRGSLQEFKQFLYFAKGSCYELETQLIIAKELEWLDIEQFERLISSLNEIMKMLQGLINAKKEEIKKLNSKF